MQTRIVNFSSGAIAEAAAMVRAGAPVAIATETVYGLAADATSRDAIAAIYAAKGRPTFNPLIVHVADYAAATRLGTFSRAAIDLADRYWPGPLTLVVPLRVGAGIATLATAGLSTIGLRVPAHRAIRALLDATATPLAAPSANASGTISATRADHVLRSLGGRIPLVIDDGATPGGIESTIIATTGDRLRLLRPGPIALTGIEISGQGGIEAPGQLSAHYAPAKALRLHALTATPDEWHIGFGDVGGDVSLSPTGDCTEAAARLFDLLHNADANASSSIAVAPIPQAGLGIAINDRLARAAFGSGQRRVL